MKVSLVFRWGRWWKLFEAPWINGYRPIKRYVPVDYQHG